MQRWLMILGLLLVAGCQTAVQHGLEEGEANRIVAALQGAGVEAHKVKEEGRGGKFAVRVPRGQVTRAIQLLQKHELPRKRPKGFGDVYGKSSLVPTATEQQARYVHALSGEIARTLEAVSGVREARVHVVLPRRDPLGLRSTGGKPRAAVFLRIAAGKPPIATAEVQRLVAGAVDDLTPDHVAVVMRPTRVRAKADPSPRFGTVGPVSVSQESKRLLQGLFAGGLVLILLLAGAVAVLTLRLTRAQRRLTAGHEASDGLSADTTARIDSDD